MMKKISNKILIALVAPFIAIGCIEETFPESQAQLKDQVTLEGLVNSFSITMMTPDMCSFLSSYGAQSDFGIPAIHLMTDSMCEDIAIMGANPGYYQFYPWAYNMGMNDQSWPTGYFWEHYYKYIKISNDVINMVSAQEEMTDRIKGYLGQAYAYRAMCYLDLGRLYEFKENKYTTASEYVIGLTVPLVTEYTTEKESKNNPRVAREELYDFILSDLSKAEAYLKNAGNSFSTPTLGAVYGLYARTYIEMGYWENGGDKEAFTKAATYARKAIETSGKTPLTESQWTDPVTGFNDGGANNSWIWGLTVAKENLQNLIAFTAHISSEALYGYGAYSFPGINKALYDKMHKKDFRKMSYLDPDYTWYPSGNNPAYNPNNGYKFAPKGDWLTYYFAVNATPYTAIKFRPAMGECIDYNIGNAADHPLMRVEEMYFIEMEAYAAMNQLDKAVTMLNDFMKYRVVDGSYDCTRLVEDFETFTDEMLLQKRAEFWGEGIVMYDYKRLNKGITRSYTNSNHPSIWQFNTDGRSPQWNLVINRGEFQTNIGIDESTNNPDPSGKLEVPSNK